ncbi:kinase-like domain-containing protein [Aspergillus carlsbadensis]|nr:kinase-like domain-containing protein [Aspergillus carlsbadensis]
MGRLPDLVRDSELETHFSPNCNVETVHTYHERKPRVRGRLAARTEHWRRLGKVGGGGFGSVWLEKCTEPGQYEPKVRAVKQMEIKQWSTQLDYNRELEAIAKFSHRKYERCFVKSFGWYKSEEHLFIAMEYLDLGDLHSYLRNNPALPEKEAREIIFQILDGINLMHDNEFTHRDLKLNNILLKQVPPNDWWVKIADFGISKRIEDGIGLPTMTKGTPGYMAPELLGFIPRGTPYAVDIWAVGEITFQLLTKRPAFESPGRLSNYVQDTSNFFYDPIHATRTTELGINFILSTLRPEPDQRISARDALEHRWMDQSLPSAYEPVSKEPTQLPVITDTDAMTEQFASWDTITISSPLTTILGKNSQGPSTTLPPQSQTGIDPCESSRPSETSTATHRTKNRRKETDRFIAQKSDRATSDYSFESDEPVISVPSRRVLRALPYLHPSLPQKGLSKGGPPSMSARVAIGGRGIAGLLHPPESHLMRELGLTWT